MANKKAQEVTKKTANTKEVKTMSKAKAVAPKTETKVETKATETKKETAKKPVEKKNTTKVNVTIQDVEKLLTEAGIGFKPNNCEYRILLSGSSLHVKKSSFVFYTTEEDFKKVEENVKAADLELKAQGNAQDGKRPNYIRFTTEDTLKKVVTALTKSVKVAVA